MKPHSLIEHLAFHLWMLVGIALLVMGEHYAAYIAFSIPLLWPLVAVLIYLRIRRRLRNWFSEDNDE